jgi:hypothetical protein
MKTAAGYVTDDENIHWASISLAWMGSKTHDPVSGYGQNTAKISELLIR